MARSKKTSTDADAAASEDTIKAPGKAPEVEETVPPPPEAEAKDDAGADDSPPVELEEPVAAENTEPAADGAANPVDPSVEAPVEAPVDAHSEVHVTHAPVVAPEPAQATGGFWNMVLGGAVAAGLGFFGAQYANDGWPFGTGGVDDALRAEMQARIDAAEKSAQAARDTAAAALQPGDVAALQDASEATRAAIEGLSGRIEAVEGRVLDLTGKVETLEKRPLAEGVSEEAIAAYERELETLREAIAAQRAEVENMAQDAAQMEASAEETARRTMARAAATRIRYALDSGEPFAAAIEDIRTAGVEPPALLADAAATGVVTRAMLQDRFPEAAREALRAWRADATGEGDTGGRLGNFLRDQLGVRSVTPREGGDPDAVLSRAEAAVRESRLADALAEIETLPDSARRAMDAWEQDARRRLDVRGALDALSQQLNEG